VGAVHELSGVRAGAALDFSTDFAQPVVMKFGTSFISVDQARVNLQREIGEYDLEQIADAAANTWERALGKIVVESEDEEQLRTFYSCLYRTQLFPRVWHELDAEGATRHFSPYDGQIHDGVLYTDNGFWDTYRTVYPLFSLLNRERLSDILQGWVHAYKEGGWFPQWASPGYRACMVGTHIDAVMADAVARGVTGFDVEAALEGMLKHADEVGDRAGAFGRIGIEDYKELGYVACDRHHEACARSLDYAYDDFCVAQVAKALGRHEEAGRLLSRVRYYEKSYDPAVGFMRGRNADGSWLEPWSEFRWGSPYVEGGPWQSSWAVQHDAAGLIGLMGGDEAFVSKLDRMLTMEPDFEVGAYGFEIHEITEMACADFGQYAHSNQPVHHVLYLYNSAGRPWRTQKQVRRVLASLYSPTLLPGDEDNGEMSAWYVLSALGFFPLCPGHGSWTLGSPLFKKATFKMPNGKDLVICAPDNSAQNVYVRSVRFNGEVMEALSIDHATLAEGGLLEFEMSPEPLEKIVPPELRPFSVPPM
jgi:predicted alpha-1,2-mannosidase